MLTLKSRAICRQNKVVTLAEEGGVLHGFGAVPGAVAPWRKGRLLHGFLVQNSDFAFPLRLSTSRHGFYLMLELRSSRRCLAATARQVTLAALRSDGGRKFAATTTRCVRDAMGDMAAVPSTSS